MASVSVIPTMGTREHNENSAGVDRLPDEMNDMKIRDDKVDVWLCACVCATHFNFKSFGALVYFAQVIHTVLTGNGTSYS